MPDSLRRLASLLIGLLLAAPAWPQQGALTVPRNLAELVERSETIVSGHVVAARVEKHPELQNLDTVVVTVRVSESFKGESGATFTFRQYLWDIRDRMNAGGYRKGQEVLLMMIAPSRYGLSSPAGLDQGRFRIERDAAGRAVARNGNDNLGLLDGVGARLAKDGAVLAPAAASLVATHRKGPVELGELTRLIRVLAAGSG